MIDLNVNSFCVKFNIFHISMANMWTMLAVVSNIQCYDLKEHLVQIIVIYWQKTRASVQCIPRNMHTVFALLCFVVVIHWLIFLYPSGLLHWHCGNLTIAPVPAKQPWWIWINTSCEFIMNDCITTTKQSTTKPFVYFLGYTVPTDKHGKSKGPLHGTHIRWRLDVKTVSALLVLERGNPPVAGNLSSQRFNNAMLLFFSLVLAWTSYWTISRVVGDLRRSDTYVTLLLCEHHQHIRFSVRDITESRIRFELFRSVISWMNIRLRVGHYLSIQVVIYPLFSTAKEWWTSRN